MQAEQGKFEPSHGSRASCLPPAPACLHGLIALFCMIVSLGSGCSRLQLPAIDPNGSSIFLPFPNTTQLELPPLHSTPGQPGLIPTPAFTTPPTPPPCLDASNGGVCNLFGHKHQLVSKLQSHFDSPGKAGEIQLTPLREVAPVGGEVVLLAGICGPDGYLAKREPLEWMLSPDSVGTFIEVGDDEPGTFASLLTHKGPKIEKLDVDFARGRTSSKETVITRGSPNCNDDIELREGQTWLSISSPSEGVSRVTVLAPDSEIWDRRRQTATIYWVDAQWEFPAPQITRSGETIQVVTRVTKAENLVPAEDWIVEYSILDPNVATFVPATGSNKATVKVNRDGQAIATIQTPPGGRGTTPIVIDVIRPAQPSDNLPRLVLGRGQTMVTFSSPGLNLESFGPQVGTVGEQLTYSAVLGNPGDVPAENVKLVMAIPAGTRFVGASLQPSQQTDGFLVWEQGVLGANQQLDVSVVLEVRQANTFDVRFQAEGASGLAAQSVPIRTEIIEPTIEVRFAPSNGIAEADVGSTVQYEIDVKNTGRSSLNDLTLLIESAAGLPEAYQGETRVQQPIPMLQPGETRQIGVTFRVQQTGPLAARLTVRSGEKVLAEKSTSIQGLPEKQKQPDIGVSIRFPETIRAGGRNTAEITLMNRGEVKLSSIRVEITFDSTLEAVRVDDNNKTRISLSPDRQTLSWNAQDLLPRLPGAGGDMIRQLYIEFESRSPIQQGTIQVRASAAEGVQAEDSTSFRSVGNEVLPPDDSVTPPPANEPPAGTFEVSIFDSGDPRLVGQEFRYFMTVTNKQNQTDRNLRVLLRYPQGVRFQSASLRDGTPVNVTFGENNTVILPDIQFIRVDEKVEYVFVVVPQVPQLMELQAQVYSDGHPDPVNASETTTILSR